MLSGVERARRRALAFCFLAYRAGKAEEAGVFRLGGRCGSGFEDGAVCGCRVGSAEQGPAEAWRLLWGTAPSVLGRGERTRRGTVCLGRGVRAWLQPFMGKGAGVRAEAGR